VILEQPQYDKTRMNQALEVSIHFGQAFLLAIACLLILRQFIPLLAWGIMVAVAAYPSFKRLQKPMGGCAAAFRGRTATCGRAGRNDGDRFTANRRSSFRVLYPQRR
jgi:hypothetical protein